MNGFLILRVDQHDAPGLQPFDAVENEITEKLYAPRMQPAVRAYLTKLRQEAFLQIREGYVDSGAAPGKDTSWQQAAKLKPQTVTKHRWRSGPSASGCCSWRRFQAPRRRSGLSSSTPAHGSEGNDRQGPSPYSPRSARTGSIEAARRAGTNAAASATTVRAPSAAAISSGSCGFTP